jgi:hypothetical protein
MLTKEENQLLINEFVEKNVDAITNLGDDKQKAIFNAILLIQNKFGNITQSLLKDDIINPKVAQPIAIIDEELPFKVGDRFINTTGSRTIIHTILEIDPIKNYFEFEAASIKVNGWTLDEAKKEFEKGEWKLVDVSQVVKNQTLTTSTTTTTTSQALNTNTSSIINKDEEIQALEEAIETQKLLLSFSETKDEKDEIKNLLKDLRSQLKKLKK